MASGMSEINLSSTVSVAQLLDHSGRKPRRESKKKMKEPMEEVNAGKDECFNRDLKARTDFAEQMFCWKSVPK